MTQPRPRRSLLLAGGGLKVAFQAGVLQVWLDEAGVEFDHADACSGGAFNLAMLCQGMTGTQVADAWRGTRPSDGIAVRLRDVLRFPYGRSLVTLDAYRKRVFPRWGLDWRRIRESTLDATFNVYDVSEHRLRTLAPGQMSEDALCACVSQSVWFPAVTIDGSVYTDAVWVTDANVEAAVERGADEIWVIWTVSTRPDWLPGLVAQFFHTIESSANGHLRRALDRIEENNARIARGEPGCYGRTITVRMLRAEVPVHYLVVLGSDRLHRAVERGVEAGRTWCAEQAIDYTPARRANPYSDGVSLRFRDTMRGRLTVTPTDEGPQLDEVSCDADLRLVIEDAGRFVTSPSAEARVEGTVSSPLFGGTVPVRDGSAQVLVDDGDPTRKQFRYHLALRDSGGQEFTLSGVKTVDSGDIRQLWRETTTLHTRILRGDRTPGEPGPVVAAGLLRLGPGDVLRQVTTARVSGPTPRSRARGVLRFALMFVGNLWDVYLRRVLSYGPF
jgi:predicted acylesterase/phospholipase RssA